MIQAGPIVAWCQPPKQSQRTGIWRRGRGANASFHCAHAPRGKRQRAAAELRRYAHVLADRYD
jgi:hypothetical protein